MRSHCTPLERYLSLARVLRVWRPTVRVSLTVEGGGGGGDGSGFLIGSGVTLGFFFGGALTILSAILGLNKFNH